MEEQRVRAFRGGTCVGVGRGLGAKEIKWWKALAVSLDIVTLSFIADKGSYSGGHGEEGLMVRVHSSFHVGMDNSRLSLHVKYFISKLWRDWLSKLLEFLYPKILSFSAMFWITPELDPMPIAETCSSELRQLIVG
ncbi:hypothetical protein V6N13_073950 [Hibiscus sabdariffa]